MCAALCASFCDATSHSQPAKVLQQCWLAVVGAPGFEPGTSCSQSRRATELRHAPKKAGRSYTKTRPSCIGPA